jgi:hypothetical protein
MDSRAASFVSLFLVFVVLVQHRHRRRSFYKLEHVVRSLSLLASLRPRRAGRRAHPGLAALPQRSNDKERDESTSQKKHYHQRVFTNTLGILFVQTQKPPFLLSPVDLQVDPVRFVHPPPLQALDLAAFQTRVIPTRIKREPSTTTRPRDVCGLHFDRSVDRMSKCCWSSSSLA